MPMLHHFTLRITEVRITSEKEGEKTLQSARSGDTQVPRGKLSED